MRTTSIILFIASIALICYGYWGAFTSSGNKVYDEMDAYFPFFLMIAGVVLLIVFLALVLIMRKKTKQIN